MSTPSINMFVKNKGTTADIKKMTDMLNNNNISDINIRDSSFTWFYILTIIF
jgi:hypothetical protein